MNKGFTLIEMIIVIAIIAILAGVFLTGFGGFRSTAQDSKRIADLKNVQSYLELYYSKNRAYPNAANWAALTTELTNPAQNLSIRSVPTDPINDASTGYIYDYAVLSGGQAYVIVAQLSTGTHAALQDSVDIDESNPLAAAAASIDCGTTSSGVEAPAKFCLTN